MKAPSGQASATDTSDLQWKMVTGFDGFRDLRAGWEKLFSENALHSPFLSWGWVNAWLRHLACSDELRILALMNSQQEVHIIVPLVTDDSSEGHLTRFVTNACGYGPECSDHLGVLWHPRYAERLGDLACAGIAECLDQHCRVRLANLSADQCLAERLKDAAAHNGRKSRIINSNVCPAVELGQDWDDFALTLSRNFRSQIRRQYKRAIQDESLDIVTWRQDQAEKFAHELIRLNKDRMATMGKLSSLEDTRFQRFLLDSVDYMARSGLAWMDVIEHQGEVVGAALNLVHGKSVYYYLGGFDSAHMKSGPGNVLFVHVMKRAIDNGYTSFDFLRGAEKYKYRWGASDKPLQDVDIYPAGFWHGETANLIDGVALSLKRARSHVKKLLRQTKP